jgi:cysteine desulfurase/selenocysteine lyase
MTQANAGSGEPAVDETATAPLDTSTSFDVGRLRADFPALHQEVHGKPLAYLDNAATTQRPQSVIGAVSGFYKHSNANVHRGLHSLSEEATTAYEDARAKVARHLGLSDPRRIVFVRGTTEAINLVAHSWGLHNLGPGDEVLLTQMEHHGNIVPWRVICDRTDATLRAAPVDDAGRIDMDAFQSMLTEKTKLVAVVHISNVLGTVNPVEEITRLAHDVGAKVLLDGAQGVAHASVDLEAIGCDFYAFSGHKCFGPMGIGVLAARSELLETMPPYQTGGEMIENVTFDKVDFADPPGRFEAGTPNVPGAIGLGAAMDYLDKLDRIGADAHEAALRDYAADALREVPGLRLIGEAAGKAPIFAFVIDGMHPYDVAPILDRQGVAIRTGHHCAQPLMECFGVPSTMRASLAAYNTPAEVDTLIAGLEKARTFLM